ncbi:MAG: hypothetical protein F6J98_29865 [Moorea sp. SIO4G2]|nr:hypothetical protein [Moorena sp. SIO4G2]
MGETTAVAHGGNPQDRAASPRPRCIALRQFLSTVPCSLFPVPDNCREVSSTLWLPPESKSPRAQAPRPISPSPHQSS